MNKIMTCAGSMRTRTRPK